LILFLIVFSSASMADDLEWTDCKGVTEDSDGTIPVPSPVSGNIKCYPGFWVDDSRVAAIHALQELVSELGLNVTISAMPISYQREINGPFLQSWEVYIYSVKTEKVLMLYIVEAASGRITKLCDNRFEDQHCRKLNPN